MSTKRKFFVSLFSMVMLMVMMIAGTIGVLSATMVNVTGVFQITYNADNVYCTVYARYIQQNNPTPVYFTMNDKSQPYIHFEVTDSGEGTLCYDPIVWDKDNYWVLFCYYFRNDNPEGGLDLRITLTDNAIKTNVDCTYYTSATELSFDSTAGYYDKIMADGTGSVPGSMLTYAQEMLYVYVLVEATSLANGASYDNIQDSCLRWTLQSANTIRGV